MMYISRSFSTGRTAARLLKPRSLWSSPAWSSSCSTDSYRHGQSGDGQVTVTDVREGIAIITMDRGENRINADFLDYFNAALDEALSYREVKAIVTTGRGKFYSNGDDVSWLKEIHKTDKEHIVAFLQRSRQLEARLLTCPVLTVAAISGHAYAGGAIMSLSHDMQVMQSERGWLCMNEAHIGIRLPRWFLQVCRVKFGSSGARALLDTCAFGRRFTAAEAMDVGIVDAVCPASDLLTTATGLISSVLTSDPVDRDHVRFTKQQIYADALSLMQSSDLSAAKSQL